MAYKQAEQEVEWARKETGLDLYLSTGNPGDGRWYKLMHDGHLLAYAKSQKEFTRAVTAFRVGFQLGLTGGKKTL